MPIRQNHDYRDGADWRLVCAGSAKAALRGPHCGVRSRVGTEAAKMCGVIDDGFCELPTRFVVVSWCCWPPPVLGHCGFNRAPRSGASRDHPAHRCGRHEGGRGRTGIERVWKERGKAISGRASDGGQGKIRRRVRDADLFQNAVWFLTPLPGQNMHEGLFAEFVGWIDQIGARVAMLPPEDHDRWWRGSAICRR